MEGYDGPTRARIYWFSYLTGLRRREMGSLTAESFDLVSDVPTVTVEAVSSKHRRKDVLPLHPELVAHLPSWMASLRPDEPLFPRLGHRKTWVMIQHDLERAGIPYLTKDGYADFHASGSHSHITGLMQNGASLAEAKELARHSDIRTTMRYTHVGLKDRAKALRGLPSPSWQCIGSDSSVAGCHRSPLNGKTAEARSAPSRDTNPFRGESSDNQGRGVSVIGTQEEKRSTGIELPQHSKGKPGHDAQGGAVGAPADPELAKVIRAWETLRYRLTSGPGSSP